MPASLLPIVVYLLQQQGHIYQLETNSDEPWERSIDGSDFEFLDFVAGGSGGVVCHTDNLLPFTLVREAAAAFADKSIIVAVMNEPEATGWADDLRQFFPGTQLLVAGSERESTARILVATFDNLTLALAKIDQRDLLFVPIARDVSYPNAALALSQIPRARAIAFQDRRNLASRSDAARIGLHFGLNRMFIPHVGYRNRDVRVLCAPCNLAPLEHGYWAFDPAALRNGEIWKNPRRSRWLTTLADGICCGDSKTVRDQMPALRGCLPTTRPTRVLLIAATSQHAVQLNEQLPGAFFSEAGSPPRQTAPPRFSGCLPAHRHAIHIAEPVAVTGELLANIDLVIRTDGHDGGAPFPLESLIVPVGQRQPLVMLDLDDVWHFTARKWAQHRKDWYAEHDWFLLDEPIDDQIVSRWLEQAN